MFLQMHRLFFLNNKGKGGLVKEEKREEKKYVRECFQPSRLVPRRSHADVDVGPGELKKG